MNTNDTPKIAIYLRCTPQETDTQRLAVHHLLQQRPDPFPTSESFIEYLDMIREEKTYPAYPRLHALLQDLQERPFSHILLYSLSALGNCWQGEWLLSWLTDHLKIRVRSVLEEYDSAREETPISTFPSHAPLKQPEAFSIHPVVEQIYHNPLLREDSGEKGNNSVFSAFGYLFDPNSPCLMVPEPDTARIVREIYQMYLSGIEIGKIARILTQRGVPSPMARRKKMGTVFHYGDNCWNSVSVLKILTNTTYIGDHTYRLPKLPRHLKQQAKETAPIPSGTVIHHHHPALISEADFEAAQILLKCQPKREYQSPPQRKFDTPFCNMVFCGVCGQPMKHRHRNNQYPNSKSLYVCSSAAHHLPNACPRIPHLTDNLIAAVSAAVSQERDYASRIREAVKDGTESQSYIAANEHLHETIVAVLDHAKQLQAITDDPNWFTAESIPETLSALVEEKDALLTAFTSPNKWLQDFDLPDGFTLDRATAKRTIKRINVFPDGRTEILLKDQEEKERLLKYL